MQAQKAVATATLTMATNITEAVNFGDFSSGIVIMPGTWTAADIGFKVCDTVDGTFAILRDAAAALVIVDGPVASNAYALPAGLAGARFIKLWSNTAGADENQAAARTLKLIMKS